MELALGPGMCCLIGRNMNLHCVRDTAPRLAPRPVTLAEFDVYVRR